MPKYKITYREPSRSTYEPNQTETRGEEEVTAQSFKDSGNWIDFYNVQAHGSQAIVLRVLASDVLRIEQSE
jgi:hypothetical protein